ncbi:hypothetical protein R8789_13445 [Streptomyces malaysiensis]|nr:hypothetical protein R8789_13445 [Streptomyces malaysiensis]
MSATQSWSGRLAVKSRSTRSGGLGADGSGTVVRRRGPRMTPSTPSSPISRSTVQRATCTPLRRSARVIRRTP